MIGKLKLVGAVIKTFAIANGPVGLFVAGLVVGAIAIVEIAKAAPETSKEIESHEDTLEQINDELKNEDLSEEDRKVVIKDKKKEVKAVAGCFLRGYWKPIILVGISSTLLCCGFLWQSKRFAVAAATAASQAATLKLVDSNIRKTYGDKAVFAMHDPNWEPSILQKEDDENAKGLEGYSDPYRNYNVNEHITQACDPANNVYLYNRYTIDPDMFERSCDEVREFVTSLNRINSEVANMNLYLSGNMREPLLSRSLFLCKNLGFIFAGCSETINGVDEGLTIGWGRGDVIDVGISDLYAKMCKCINEPYALSKLAEEYKDGIPLKLNCTYAARDNCLSLPAYGNR